MVMYVDAFRVRYGVTRNHRPFKNGLPLVRDLPQGRSFEGTAVAPRVLS
jgi:hypothetical protein